MMPHRCLTMYFRHYRASHVCPWNVILTTRCCPNSLPFALMFTAQVTFGNSCHYLRTAVFNHTTPQTYESWGWGLGTCQVRRLPGLCPWSPAAFEPRALACYWDTGSNGVLRMQVLETSGSGTRTPRNRGQDLEEELHWSTSLAWKYFVHHVREKRTTPPPKNKQVNSK